MSLTLVKRTIQIFAGLGSVSTASLVPSFIGKGEENKLPKRDRQISNNRSEEPKEENVLQRAVQIMESKEGNQKGEKRCFWLFAEKNWFELLMCVNMKTLKPITLFYYTWKDKELKEVMDMTYNGTSILKITFESRGTKDLPIHLRTSFAWYRRGTKSFIPSSHCQMERVGETSAYTLTCKDPNHTETRGLTKRVVPELPSGQ